MMRKMTVKSLFGPLVLAVSLAGVATSASAEVVVQDAWARATVPGQPATGAFMTLTADTDSTLLSVQSPVAALVQVHQSSMHDDVMKMTPADTVSLPAGKPVVLEPSGYHVMLMQLHGQVKEGDVVPLTLQVKDASGITQTVQVQAVARALNQPDAHQHSH